MIDLTGRVALVTGASRGIGRAIADEARGAGRDVVAAARGENAAGTVEEITAAGGKAEVASVDVARRRGDRRAGRAARWSGTAGSTSWSTTPGSRSDQLMLRMKRDDWDAVIATNLTGGVRAHAGGAEADDPRRSGGRIICISSVVGQSGNAGQANYAASKAGLIGFAKAVAQEVASRNITVNVVAPGLIETDMTRAITGGRARRVGGEDSAASGSARPDDVAAAVCFLASDEAAYITGQVLAVNGGMYM